jgi:hypothetical protein
MSPFCGQGEFMQSIEIQTMLKHYEYMWARTGPIAKSGDVIGYARIGGRKFGQEIWLNHYGLPQRPDWRYSIYEDGKRIWVNRHFKPKHIQRRLHGST